MSGWKFVDPGGSGWTAFPGIHPADGSLYVSSDMKCSLFRSRDRGESWEPISNPVTGSACCLAGDPGNRDILYMNQISEEPRDERVHGEAAGIPRSCIVEGIEAMFRDRAFLTRTMLPSALSRIWRKDFVTPLKLGSDYLPRFALG
jgi:hypothetical protein